MAGHFRDIWAARLLTFLAAFAIALPASAAIPAAPAPTPVGTLAATGPGACAALIPQDFSTLAGAPTKVFKAMIRPATADTPELCLVDGYVSPTVGFRLWLPTATWNGKFAQNGCGGRCQDIPNERCEIVVARSYACLAADMGHKSSVFDDIWAINNVQGEIDFGFRATHVVAIAGKAVIAAFYGRPPRLSYFFGNSTGGRQALVEAQRFPADFDGIISADPALGGVGVDQNAMRSGSDLITAALYRDGKAILTPADLLRINAHVIARCDKADGLADGIITDPRACDPDLAALGLSAGQIAGVTAMYRSGRLPGSERQWIGSYITEDGRLPAEVRGQANRAFSGYGWLFGDGSNPDLRAFKARGGKLILYHGLSDEATSPLATTDYFETMQRTVGGPAVAASFTRLYLIPGKSHIPLNGAAETIDYLSYLEAWVERGQAPGVLLARHLKVQTVVGGPVNAAADLVPGNTAFSRPVYPYPAQAHYLGRGDPNSADSFGPVMPRAAR